MIINDRLLAVSSLINDNESVLDIGCDHGLLDVYLTLYKNCRCKAIDVNNNIIKRAYDNFSKYNVTSKIDLVVGNGFNDLNIDFNSVMVLAGMGTSTIIRILEKNRSASIVCQTNTDLFLLRKSVCSYGYYIENENLVYDNGRYYVTIRFSKGIRKYSYSDYLLGPVLVRSRLPIFNEYVNYLYKKNINGYQKALYYNQADIHFKMMMETLKKYI